MDPNRAHNVFCFEIVGAVVTWIDMIWKKENFNVASNTSL
jgi:hypothetical protein